jgi:hypothetical protein
MRLQCLPGGSPKPSPDLMAYPEAEGFWIYRAPGWRAAARKTKGDTRIPKENVYIAAAVHAATAAVGGGRGRFSRDRGLSDLTWRFDEFDPLSPRARRYGAHYSSAHYSSVRPCRCQPSVPPRRIATSCKPASINAVAACAERRSVLQTTTIGCLRLARSGVRAASAPSGTLTAPGKNVRAAPQTPRVHAHRQG